MSYAAHPSLSDIESWKKNLLDMTRSGILLALTPEYQTKVGMWDKENVHKLPYPTEADVRLTPGGGLVLDARIDEHLISFILWVQVGEIRIGVKAPQALANNSVGKWIKESYDGVSCSRAVEMLEWSFFDWIFREGFADFGFMAQSTRDDLMTAIIADRLSGIVTHLYLSVISGISELCGYAVLTGRITDMSKLDTIVVRVEGDANVFRKWAEHHAKIVSMHDDHSGHMFSLMTDRPEMFVLFSEPAFSCKTI